MHTFFVNTSEKPFRNYDDILDIQVENKKFISLHYPIKRWNDEKTGYKACVKQMGVMIDNYKRIDNDFNLIIFTDLTEFSAYADSSGSARNNNSCALHEIIKRYMYKTIYTMLKDYGRNPNKVLIIFEENKPVNCVVEEIDGAEFVELMGLPKDTELVQIKESSDAVGKTDVISNEVYEKVVEYSKERQCLDGLAVICEKEVIEWIASTYEGDYNSAGKNLKENFYKYDDDDEYVIDEVSFITKRFAGSVNRAENAKRELRLCLALFAFIENEAFLKEDSEKDAAMVIPDPDNEKWNEIIAALNRKKGIFDDAMKKTAELAEKYHDLGLVPRMKKFCHSKFAMDQYGKIAKQLTIEDVKPGGKSEEDEKTGILKSNIERKTTLKEAKASSIIKCELFDYKKDDASYGNPSTPEEYEKAALAVREHHLDYLVKLQHHIKSVLSKYAGKAADNSPALLKKRRVSVANEDYGDTPAVYNYATSPVEDEDNIDTIGVVSETAYSTAQKAYFEFCAGRSVGLTDIEEQTDWFVTRIAQIKESMKKIKTVAAVMPLAVLGMYTPFLFIQWEYIFSNVISLATAACSFAVPLVILEGAVAAVAAFQRRRYNAVWKEFLEKSKEVSADNDASAKMYDELLTFYIPTLRYVYEYKSDVEFYFDCCKTADAKVKHHFVKLKERVETIGNIVEDLEGESVKEPVKNASKSRKINYGAAFCDEANRDFYSIIDREILNIAGGTAI